MTAILCVTAVVDPAVADDFDKWYETEHIPEARRLLTGILSVSRWRSTTTTNQVSTVYEFENAEQVRVALDSEAIKTLITEFDRKWADKVIRERSGHELIFRTAKRG